MTIGSVSSGTSVLATGLQGVQKSSQAMQTSAQDIVRAGTVERDSSSTLDIADPLINLKAEQQVFDASANVVQVASDTLGSLLDIKA